MGQKGEAATEAWNEARKRTTAAGLGGMVYAKLLRSFEYVMHTQMEQTFPSD